MKFTLRISELFPDNLFDNRSQVNQPEWHDLLRLARVNNDYDYASQQSKISVSLMVKRLRQLGFVGMDEILDVGCGYGQWSRVLSVFNSRTTGIDPSKIRIEIANEIFVKNSPEALNLNYQLGFAESTNFKDESFDGIFCFGVFMFTQPDKALREFSRILKKNGRLYIVTNSDGWWLYLFIRSIIERKKLNRKYALRALIMRSKSNPTSFTKKSLRKIVQNNGFRILGVGSEGEIHCKSSAMSTYKQKFLGAPVTIEILAIKND